MDKKYNKKVNKKIAEILNGFLFELNDEKTRMGIANEIKIFLEQKNIDYETLNVYTSPERVDMGLIDIRIDNELYPFQFIKLS